MNRSSIYARFDTRCLAPTLLAVFLSVFVCHPVFAAVYKWVDENGKVHYGDHPPAENTQQMKLKAGPAPSKTPDTDEERRKKQKRLLDAFAKERADKKAAQAQAETEEKQRGQWCAKARDDLAEIRSASYVYDYDKDGNQVVYSKEAREKATRDYEKRIKKFC